ncbi:hypothetical protein LP316_13935 [Thalassotalea sp. LPB0316]|uniref:hypothetical protein n=1 Tax=Thalassotalea sp. LPB0316 TaxID=2769490 RepID=UPI001868CA41|nr:hypothetical protein [Thalassotalea sp. LPB0316]QOL25379.1 hypothetical protein LP316_13935 [Thalassotalea sp. LPB0316]
MKSTKIKQYATRYLWYCALLASSPSYAVGEMLINKVMQSDFIFDRNISNVPFLPIGYLQYTKQNQVTIENRCEIELNCQFNYQSISQGFGLPVYVDKKYMIILGQTIESNHVETAFENYRIDTVGLLAAVVAQPSVEWQVGAFYYGYRGIGGDHDFNQPRESVVGAVGRYRHSARFHSYWGAVSYNTTAERIVMPYIGFDWFIDQQWSIGGVMPWPVVAFAPNKNNVFKVGGFVNGAEWQLPDDNNITGQTIDVDFGQANLGIAYERRIRNQFWGEFMIGHSGFGAVKLTDSGLSTDSHIDGAPFIRFSLFYRPE